MLKKKAVDDILGGEDAWANVDKTAVREKFLLAQLKCRQNSRILFKILRKMSKHYISLINSMLDVSPVAAFFIHQQLP